nr:Protein F37C4.5 [Haemonchus contortus]
MDAPATVDLHVSYQVYCASWRPAYDIRVITTTEGDQDNSIKLCYYGLVEQNTGDDWNDTDMVLSTSTPSVGGCAPQLATLSASIHRPSKYQRQRNASAALRKPMYSASEEDMGFGSFDCNEMADAVALHRYNTAQLSRSSEENSVSAPSIENLVSTCFSIPREVTIPSNGVEHKVLVAMFDLTCSFIHECVPSRSASAYLSAVITNTTPFPLPPGDAAVYLNNGFVTKAHLRTVLPGDEFRCSLGVDPSIKIEYKTPTVTHEQVGFMSKSTLLTHEQIIYLRNAKAMQSVQVTVKEQIPKSTDEKIKVAIVSPEIRAKNSEAKLNKDHNLEWTVVLVPGQQKDLRIKYTVEHPASESLSFKLAAQ